MARTRTPALRRRRRSRRLLVAAIAVAVLAAAAAGNVFAFSGATLGSDPSALARISLEPFAGSIASVRASDARGRAVPITLRGGALTPRSLLSPGEQISVTLVVRRPGWSAWALGSERRETLTVRAPAAHVLDRWPTAPAGGQVRVRFDTPVSAVSFGGARVPASGRAVVLPTKKTAGSVIVAAAARPWERLGAPVRVTWFPRTPDPAVLASPAPGSTIPPRSTLRLTFARPVDDVLSGGEPELSPHLPGHWARLDDHTLVFRPSGYGAPFDSSVHVRLPAKVALAGTGLPASREIDWKIAPVSFLRLQQLLAEDGYLPVDWAPSSADAPRTLTAQLAAAVSPPEGSFHWRYPNTPPELQALWTPGEPGVVTRGAVMMFQDEHHLTVDGIAGPHVWHALLADALAGKRRTDGYSYVYVHRNVPQLLTLWHNGRTVLTSPGNTGVPAAPTQLGTWPVFEHIPVGRMSGTNPDGSHYDDPGIRWISYFHGGEALHAFNRASFGTPQSLGCVELPLDAAGKVWPYTPIGTLVTIEN